MVEVASCSSRSSRRRNMIGRCSPSKYGMGIGAEMSHAGTSGCVRNCPMSWIFILCLLNDLTCASQVRLVPRENSRRFLVAGLVKGQAQGGQTIGNGGAPGAVHGPKRTLGF